MQVRKLDLDRNLRANTISSTELSALACLKAVSSNMELIMSWFEINAHQSAQSISKTLEQLLATGKFSIHLPTMSHQCPFLTCVYTSSLSGASTAVELSMSRDGLADFVSKLYLNRHQEIRSQSIADFDARIDTFLDCYKVRGVVCHMLCLYPLMILA